MRQISGRHITTNSGRHTTTSQLLGDRPEELGFPFGLQLGLLLLDDVGALLQELCVRLGRQVVDDLAEKGICVQVDPSGGEPGLG